MRVGDKWALLKVKKVNSQTGDVVIAHRVHMHVVGNKRADQVHFGNFDDRQVAIKARDMAILKFRSDKVHLVEQEKEWVDRVVCASWDSFWTMLGRLRDTGRKCTGGSEATKDILRDAWRRTHKAVYDMVDRFEEGVRERALQLVDDLNPGQHSQGKNVVKVEKRKKK